MLRYIVILFALTPCCWSEVSQASICNTTTINEIKEKVWKNGIPKDIIKTGKSWGKLQILMTTAGHYSDEEHLNFASVTFNDSSVTLVLKYETSSEDQQKKFDIIEKEGELFDEATKEHRYYLNFGDDGVRCLYRCSDTGKTGAPDGLIEASEHGYSEDARKQCIKALELLGIHMSPRKFNNHCPH